MEPGNLWTYYRETNEKKFEFPPVLPLRPGFNDDPSARSVSLRVNQFRISEWPDKSVWQYDVSQTHIVLKLFTLIHNQVKIGTGAEPRGLLKLVWNSPTVQDFLGAHAKYWLWDGNKIAWYA